MSNGARAVVAGGGVAGLAAGIALRRVGFRVVVLERSPQATQFGGGLKLWTNATRALKALGVGEQTRAGGEVIERVQFCTKQGMMLADWDVGALGRKHGAPTMGIRRPVLYELLVDALGADALRLEAEVTGFEEAGNGVEVQLADGRVEPADFLVGADGVHSVVRAQLGRPETLRYAGYLAWRAVVRPPEGSVPANTFRHYWGRGARFVFYPTGDGHVYFDAMANGTPDADADAGSRKQALRDCFSEFGEPVQTIIEAADEASIARTAIYDRAPARRWGEGHVTLAGDAAHPMTPNQGQGAGSSLEDAVTLGNILSSSSDLAAGLRRYEEVRRRRTGEFVVVSRVIGSMGRWDNPIACGLRTAAMTGMYATVAWKREKAHVAIDFGAGPLRDRLQ